MSLSLKLTDEQMAKITSMVHHRMRISGIPPTEFDEISQQVWVQLLGAFDSSFDPSLSSSDDVDDAVFGYAIAVIARAISRAKRRLAESRRRFVDPEGLDDTVSPMAAPDVIAVARADLSQAMTPAMRVLVADAAGIEPLDRSARYRARRRAGTAIADALN